MLCYVHVTFVLIKQYIYSRHLSVKPKYLITSPEGLCACISLLNHCVLEYQLLRSSQVPKSLILERKWTITLSKQIKNDRYFFWFLFSHSVYILAGEGTERSKMNKSFSRDVHLLQGCQKCKFQPPFIFAEFLKEKKNLSRLFSFHRYFF